ncbi:uncharacterized protein LTR77_005658 [Saxophila tyrrhenica]|uniref:NAD(P)-binding protein n=1 Tax=Saxophila tyrrhenica TaxID=1690608 RepID=A0AAV9P9W0_9PEZI|nr:hypothetical protein LTR77_005658 [Saxophila tyrrhenica]
MPNYLITGANRGLGLGFITTLAKDQSNTVIGLVRDQKAAEEQVLPTEFNNVYFVEADIVDTKALKLAAERVQEIVGAAGLDVLICNAAEHDIQAAIADTRASIDVNVVGSLKAVNAFLPHIRKGGLKKVVAVSSGMGDIDFINEARISNAAPYATSKAALSTLFAKLGTAYEDEGILFMSLCPGLVDTAIGPPSLSEGDLLRFQNITARFEKYAPGFKATSPTDAAQKCLAAIERSSLQGGSGGSFLSHNGTKRWM